MAPLLIALTTFASTALGGLFALRNRDRLRGILGFTAGVLLGVVAFDLLPEIDVLVRSTGTAFTAPMEALVVGFLAFQVVEKLTVIHFAHETEYAPGHRHNHPEIGLLSALALSAHSFFDGVGIGLAFQVSPVVGLGVALAVIAHDFSDGLNTVALMLLNGNTSARTLALLALDATTPILGAASTLFFSVGDRDLLLYLGFFAGFLLYVGASDILPESHADHPSQLTLLLTITGSAFVFLITLVLHD